METKREEEKKEGRFFLVLSLAEQTFESEEWLLLFFARFLLVERTRFPLADRSTHARTLLFSK